MLHKAAVLFAVLIFTAEAAFLDTLEKCKVSDWGCQKNLLQKVLSGIGKSGIPEFGIPPVDPFIVKDVTVSVLNLVNITMIDGIVKGVKNCIVEKLETDVENDHATMEMICDITVKGQYKVEAEAPFITTLLGGNSIHGEGIGKVALEKFHMKFDYHILVRDVQGEQYIQCQYKDLNYTYSLGKATFSANNLYVGKTEASAFIVTMLNDNWKFIMDTFGKPFLDKAMDIAYEQSHKFFDVVPTKYYLIEDLKPYIKKYE